MTFRLTVRYAAGNEQVHDGLDGGQVAAGAAAFLRDLVRLEGQGITRMTAEVEPVAPEHLPAPGEPATWAPGDGA